MTDSVQLYCCYRAGCGSEVVRVSCSYGGHLYIEANILACRCMKISPSNLTFKMCKVE